MVDFSGIGVWIVTVVGMNADHFTSEMVQNIDKLNPWNQKADF